MPEKIEALETNSIISYLAIGDSYTIGEAVLQQDSFPFQLQAALNTMEIPVAQPVVIAKTGWTTDELLTAIEEARPQPNFGLITLLIGVNNQYRGYAETIYRKEIKKLIAIATSLVRGDVSRIFIVSIPDWGCTPFGVESGRDTGQITVAINRYNQICREEAHAQNICFTDITPASRNAATDPELLASDGLHPSGKMYAAWAKAVAPKVRDSLDRKKRNNL